MTVNSGTAVMVCLHRRLVAQNVVYDFSEFGPQGAKKD